MDRTPWPKFKSVGKLTPQGIEWNERFAAEYERIWEKELFLPALNARLLMAERETLRLCNNAIWR